MPSLIDLTGRCFGKLTVVQKEASKKGYHGAMWLCRCDCGNDTIANAQNLKSGNTTSCGCFGRERRNSAVITHGKSGTRIHRIWKAMRTRCYNPKFFAFKYYGGRGIKICDDWNDFNAFYEWAISNGYSEDLTIDRIDVDGDYSPDNCRWITMAEQNKNKRAENGYKIEKE